MASRLIGGEYALPPRPARQPAGRWLCAALRADIARGRLGPGDRLPSSRRLAELADVARGTAVAALEQLQAEGYVHARLRAGVFVADRSRPPASAASAVRAPSPRVAPAVAALAPFVRFTAPPRRAFVTNQPAVDHFPLDTWARLLGRRARHASVRELIGGEAFGYRPLRDAVADYLRKARGVVCSRDQVVILSGVQEALAVATRLLLRPGDRVAMEDPGYPGARRAFEAAGARVTAVPIDDLGMRVPADRGAHRLAYVTPAHQFPLGIAMAYARRLALLAWARRTGALVLEDDYDSEFRFSGQPLPALQSLDAHGQVIFLGSFNKLLFPSLRLGYLVVPPSLVDPARALLTVSGHDRPFLDQAALCDFIDGGHLFRHVRRMRRIYGARRAVLAAALQERLAGALALAPTEAGLQAFARLLAPVSSTALATAAAAADVIVAPLARYRARPSPVDGIVLGFAAVDEREIRAGVDRLARILDRRGR